MKVRLAAFAVLCLLTPAQAQESCISRPSIQQKLLPLVVPLRDALTEVAVGRDETAEAMRLIREVRQLVSLWPSAPEGVDGCRKRVK